MQPPIPGNCAHLESHPTARNCAIAASRLIQGSTVVVVPSLVHILISSEKGNRCDFCFRVSDGQRKLRKCTGCASYWYCSVECQSLEWKNHHKKICKNYLSFTSSNSFQALQSHEKLDALLLAHLLAQEHVPNPSSPQDTSLPMSTFLSLLPGPQTSDEFRIPVPNLKPATSPEITSFLYGRFSNNNFAIHSHLSTVGHGIFPLSSRLFNHSCYPNAAPKYLFTPAGVVMEVVALRDIQQGEEICIPYLDPAMLQTRHQIFELTYGFKCTCSSCVELKGLGDIPFPPNDPHELSTVSKRLRIFVGLEKQFSDLPKKPRETIPQSIHCVFHETYLSTISEVFSKASHESQYETAVEAGVTLLGVYILIYPPNYPQIGVHLLELSKTAWNMFVSVETKNPNMALAWKESAQSFLNMSRKVLMTLGQEGDAGGPLSEIATLQSLLES